MFHVGCLLDVSLDGRSVCLVRKYRLTLMDCYREERSDLSDPRNTYQKASSLYSYGGHGHGGSQKLSLSMVLTFLHRFMEDGLEEMDQALSAMAQEFGVPYLPLDPSMVSLHLVMKGPGWFRSPRMSSLSSRGVSIQSFTEISVVPFNGVRPKSKRRV